MPSHQNTVIIIAGPTAVGKTAIAISVAKQLGTEIISADSRQCFKELKIGVARPSEEELQEVKHHFIATHSIQEKITAAYFERYALKKTEELFERYPTLVLAGGTGLYIKAFSEGLDDIPEVPSHIHEEVVKAYNEGGRRWLQEQLEQYDPQFAKSGEMQNPHRMMRALEVYRATGHSILSFRKNTKAARPFRMIKLALELPRAVLNERIDQRVDAMIARGLVEEARSLTPQQQLNALQTVGYKELFDYFNGVTDLSEAISRIKKNTRNYAKRQMTWFRKDKEFQWLPPDASRVTSLLQELV